MSIPMFNFFRSQPKIESKPRIAKLGGESYVKPIVEILEPGVIGETRKGVNYVGYTHVPMLDWDWPDTAHKAVNSVTIRHLGDATENLYEYAKKNPESRYRMYMTPGGVHAFDIAQRETPIEYFSKTKSLNVDPNYIRMAVTQTLTPGPFYNPNGIFYSRISPKLERENDFVGYYLGDIGTALPDPQSMRQLATYHDQKISRYLTPEAQAAAQKLLAEQIAKVSPTIVRQWGL